MGGGWWWFDCNKLIQSTNYIYLKITNLEDFYLLTTIFPFDSATTGHGITLIISMWIHGIGFKEVTYEKCKNYD